MNSVFILVLCLLVSQTLANKASKPVFDPFNVFCGTDNCYDVLGVERADNITVISKAYRQLSKTVHPDKVHPDKRMNVTEQFRLISKAYEVLKGNESRPSFDFYLDHPRSYFKATGKHAWRALPKAHPILVLLLSMLFLSGVMHYVQISKHERARNLLQEQVRAGLGPSKGGTKLSADLHNKAVRLYEAHCKANGVKLNGSPFSSPAAKEQMAGDAVYDKVCGQVLQDIQDWGEYAMPIWQDDLFVIKCFTSYPGQLAQWWTTYRRRHLSGQPLTAEDKGDMARGMVGASAWAELSDKERQAALEARVYESAGYDAWLQQREGPAQMSKRQAKLQKKQQRLGVPPREMEMPRDLTE